MLLNYRFRLYPSKSQARLLDRALEIHRQLYNAALQERREAWRMCRKSINYYDQANQLKDIREFDEDAAWLNFSSVQQTLRRLDKAFTAFFRRIKAGKTPGFPRFKSKKRWRAIEYRYGDGASIQDNRRRIQNIGRIKTIFHRPIPTEAEIKQIVVRRESPQHWWATFFIELPDPEPLPSTDAIIGIDVGLESFLTTSDGDKIANPRFFRRDESRLARVQRHQSREAKGSAEHHHRARTVAKIHRRICNRRDDFTHKLSRRLVETYQLIAFEQLEIQNMQQNHRLSKSIADAAWGQLLSRITYKAESAGRVAVAVDPRGTSQQCSRCDTVVLKDLSVRVHICSHCGLTLDRDVNAALNILALGLQGRGFSPRCSPVHRGA